MRGDMGMGINALVSIRWRLDPALSVMAGPVPATYARTAGARMAGTGPAMTVNENAILSQPLSLLSMRHVPLMTVNENAILSQPLILTPMRSTPPETHMGNHPVAASTHTPNAMAQDSHP